METTVKIEDNYLGILSSLSDNIKLRIINKLSESLLTKKAKNASLIDSFGAWKDDDEAEDIIKRVREARHFRLG